VQEDAGRRASPRRPACEPPALSECAGAACGEAVNRKRVVARSARRGGRIRRWGRAAPAGSAPPQARPLPGSW
jgi:hypothetical protein